MSQYPERIANLTAEVRDMGRQLADEKSRVRVLESDMLSQAEASRVLTLAASYGPYADTMLPRLLVLLNWLDTAVMAADPLRSVPLSDTSRVAHPESTAVEAAFESLGRERTNLVWVGSELEHLINRIRDRIAPDEVPAKERVSTPQCWKRPCRGRRGRVGDKHCGVCGKPFSEGVQGVAG